MIKAGELHRYFMVREISTGREVWLDAGDTRYEITSGDPNLRDHYRMCPTGAYILVRPGGEPLRPWLLPLRLDEVEPLPDGRGLYHPDCAASRALGLSMSYKGSWREHAARMVA